MSNTEELGCCGLDCGDRGEGGEPVTFWDVRRKRVLTSVLNLSTFFWFFTPFIWDLTALTIWAIIAERMSVRFQIFYVKILMFTSSASKGERLLRKLLLKIYVALCFRSKRTITEAESEDQTSELDSSPAISQPQEKRGSLRSRFSRFAPSLLEVI